MKLKINKRNTGKLMNTWKLNNIPLNNQQIKTEITGEQNKLSPTLAEEKKKNEDQNRNKQQTRKVQKVNKTGAGSLRGQNCKTKQISQTSHKIEDPNQ